MYVHAICIGLSCRMYDDKPSYTSHLATETTEGLKPLGSIRSKLVCGQGYMANCDVSKNGIYITEVKEVDD